MNNSFRNLYFRRLGAHLIGRWFGRVPVSENLLQELRNNQNIILITQSRSWVMQGLVQALCRKARVATPSYFAQNTNSEDLPLDNTAPQEISWYSLNDETHLSQLSSLLDTGRLKIVSCFALRGPIKSRPRYRLTLLDEIQLLFRRRFLHVSLDPLLHDANAGTQEGASEMSPKRFTRKVRLEFYRVLKQVRGTPIQTRAVQAQVIFSGPEFDREIRLIAQKMGCDEQQARAQATALFYQISANPRPIWYSILAWVSRRITNRMFSGVRLDGIDTVKNLVRDHTVILVPMHRSHLDYIFIGSELYHAELNPPLVAAGFNLSFFPAGFLIRSVGGYFVKRDARHDRLHALVLRRYVTYLLQRGHLQEFFIEGGRSRSGRMLHPKLGLLSIMVEAYRKSAQAKSIKRDVLFVPVSITYESVVEDRVFGSENSGADKERESFWALLKARGALRAKYGEVVVRFGDNISLKKLENSLATIKNNNETVLPDRSQLVRELGYRLVRNIRDGVSPTLKGFACTGLFIQKHYALVEQELEEIVKEYALLVEQLGAPVPTTALKQFLSGDTSLLREIADQKAIHSTQVLGKTLLYVPGNKRFTADFYRNSVAHFLLIPSLVATAQVVGLTPSVEQIRKLLSLLSNEWLLDENIATIESSLQKLVTAGVVSKDSENHYRVTNKRWEKLCVLPLATYESILWIHRNLQNIPLLTTQPISPFLNDLQKNFKFGVKLGIASRTEAGSQTSLTAALEALAQRGVIELRDINAKKREFRRLQEASAEFHTLENICYGIRRWLAHTQTESSSVQAETSEQAAVH